MSVKYIQSITIGFRNPINKVKIFILNCKRGKIVDIYIQYKLIFKILKKQLCHWIFWVKLYYSFVIIYVNTIVKFKICLNRVSENGKFIKALKRRWVKFIGSSNSDRTNLWKTCELLNILGTRGRRRRNKPYFDYIKYVIHIDK